MGVMTITLDEFTVNKKHDIDRDNPYLWIIGINMDRDAGLVAVAVSAGTRSNLDGTGMIITRDPHVGNLGEKFSKGERRQVPAGIRTIRETVIPIGNRPATFSLIVTAMEHSTTSRKTQEEAYNAAVQEVENFILARMRALQLEAPTDAELDTLQDNVRAAVVQVFKPNIFSDNFIATQQLDFTLGSTAQNQNFTLRFVSKQGGTDYTLTGSMVFAV